MEAAELLYKFKVLYGAFKPGGLYREEEGVGIYRVAQLLPCAGSIAITKISITNYGWITKTSLNINI